MPQVRIFYQTPEGPYDHKDFAVENTFSVVDLPIVAITVPARPDWAGNDLVLALKPVYGENAEHVEPDAVTDNYPARTLYGRRVGDTR